MISVLILTKNEAQDLPGCLASVAWSDDVQVFDSFSTDQTVAIAQVAGANVVQRRFDDYAAQRNAALQGLPFKHAWVLILDADERCTPALAEELRRFVVSASTLTVAARMRRRDFLYGTWLKHAQLTPFYLRLVRPKNVRYEREINEVLVPQGEVADLTQCFDHYPFSKGIAHWLEKHNAYSSMEARRALAERKTSGMFSLKIALWHADLQVRRFHQKGLFYKLPGRPLLKFFYMLLWRRAFLDGRAGITYAVLQSIYEYFIVLKERELTAAENLKSLP